ncbi:MAG: DUF1538 domain-containing protein [Clostridia bacterium]|nr:DUF1538 domain-containing protein [Clostridia bacterium]MBR2908635.1 DUF1538 domain-containing protein [Clostridia bacterium]
MLHSLLKKFEEALTSVLPVSLIVIVLSFTPLISLSATEMGVFIVSSILLIIGIGMFNLGADIAMTPMGEQIGSGLTRSGNMKLLVTVAFLMGLLITVAEPDLSVLAAQVSKVMNGTSLILAVGVGVGLFLLLSVLKIVFKKHLSSMLLYFYMILFALSALLLLRGNGAFLALAFDSGGVTTGPITVPFIMALGVGIASALGGKDSSENSFGLISMCSIGPILAVMLLGVGVTGSIDYTAPDYTTNITALSVLETLLHTLKEVSIALGLIVAFFIVLQIFCLKLPKKKLLRIAVGILYTFIGLVIFLTVVTVGFMPIGYKIGTELASGPSWVLVGFGFLLGMVVVLAEPAVHVLNKQVENITDGTVSRRSMMLALSIGVGISIGLSMLRIVLDFNILYYVIPGYLVSLGLSFFVPGLYTAIAFDSGGVASGPLTSGFILPLSIGACCALQGESAVMSCAFGIVAMVAMTPLITIQLLGFKAVVSKRVSERIARRRILDADDEQIIRFM